MVATWASISRPRTLPLTASLLAALIICQPKLAPLQLIIKRSVLRDEIINDRLLAAVDPVCEGRQKDL